MRNIGIVGIVLLVLLAVVTVPAHAQRVPSGEQEMATPHKPSPFPVYPKWLGELCWKGSFTENENGPIVPSQTATLSVSLTSVGGTSYLAQVLSVKSPSTESVIMSGGGFSLGTDLLLTAASTHDDGPTAWRETGTFHFQLNTNTWAGTLRAIFANYNASTHAFEHGWVKGTLTPVACP